MCNSGFFCPNGLCWDSAVGACGTSGGGGGGELPPGLAAGRPFLTAKLAPTMASPVELASDWAIEV